MTGITQPLQPVPRGIFTGWAPVSATFEPFTKYAAGQLVIFDNGLYQAKVTFTAGAAFDVADWDAMTATSPVDSVNGLVGAVDLDGFYLAPLTVSAVVTTADTPTAGQITRYNATAGPLAPVLPPLAGLADGTTFGVQKASSDSSINTITVTCTAGDAFDSTGTTLQLKVPGEVRTLQVVTIGGTTFWKVVSGNVATTAMDARYVVKVAAPSGDATGATDLANINAAFAALPAGGGQVVLQAGTYKISGPIEGYGNTSLRGAANYGTTILNLANTTAIHYSAGHGTRRVYIADLRIDDNLAAGARTAGHGVHIDGSTDASVFAIERVHVQQHFDGFRVEAPIASKFDMARSNNARNDGFSMYGAGSTVSFIATYAVQCVRHGYYTDGQQSTCTMNMGIADQNGGDGLHADHVAADGCHSWTLNSFHTEDSGGYGIWMLGGHGHTFNSLHVTNHGANADGVRLDGTIRTTIISPYIYDNGGYGLNVLAGLRAASVTLITPDDIFGNVAGQISDLTGAVTQLGTALRAAAAQARWHVGEYYGANAGTPGSIAQGLNVMTLMPLWVPRGKGADRITAEITAAVLNAVFRLGVYADDGTGRPSATAPLILDAGTIDGNSATPQEIIIALLLAGYQETLFWTAGVAQVASCSARTVGAGALAPVGGTNLANSWGVNGLNGYYKTGIAGALPDPLGAITGPTTQTYQVKLRST